MASEFKTCGTCGHAMIASESATCTKRPGAVKSVRSVDAYACEAYTSDSLERVALDALRVVNDAAEDMHGAGMFSEAQAAWRSYGGLKARLRELGVGE